MAEIIINKERYECAPAVAAYIKELKSECTRLKKAHQKARDAIAKNYCPRCGAKMDGGADDARAGESE